METNELIISRHNRHCLQCRSIAHNVLWIYFSSGNNTKPSLSYAKRLQIQTYFQLKTEPAIE